MGASALLLLEEEGEEDVEAREVRSWLAGAEEAMDIWDWVFGVRVFWVRFWGEAVYMSSSSVSSWTSWPVSPLVWLAAAALVLAVLLVVVLLLRRGVVPFVLGVSCASSSSSEEESSSSSEDIVSGLVTFLRFLRSSSTTSLKSAKRRIDFAASASFSSTLYERRALACAVARRMSVSRVRAVMGDVLRWFPSSSSLRRAE